MGNPALIEFQDKLSEMLADALFGKAAALMMAERNVPPSTQITEPVSFTKKDITHVIEKITKGWHAEINHDLYRDAEGVVIDGMDIVYPGREPFTNIVRLKVTTHFDRDETTSETAIRKQQLAALLWKPENGPPPKGVNVIQLLDQDTWWIPKGSGPIRLADMTDSHRHNLAAFLRRNAAHYKHAQWSEDYALILGPLGPQGDMAMDGAESAMRELERSDPLEWLSRKPLLRALIPTVYLWQDGNGQGGDGVTCHAVRGDNSVLIATLTAKRRRTALAGVQPPAAEAAYREAFGGVGPAFYTLITLKRGESLSINCSLNPMESEE